MRRFMIRSLIILSIILIIWIILAPGCMTFRTPDSEMKEKFSQAGVNLSTETVKINNRNIHYAKTGNDTLPTLLFIHGTPGSWDAFAGYMQDKDLLKQYRMISIDRPGFGYSDFGDPLHLSEQSILLNHTVSKLRNGKPMYLLGHSLGGPMIILMAADNPEYYNGLVLISGSVDALEEKPEKWRPVLFKTPLNYLIPGAFRPSNEELWYLKKDLVDLKANFTKIISPVYFIHGEQDTWVPPGNVIFAKKLLVNSPRIDQLMIPDGNHFIPWTKYQEIKNVLLGLDSSWSNLGPKN
ncbi:MAG: alpha/beta hydrolase [Chitinophagaceae bacterium]|nr:MAG: alpha/beta hydrolase [Chitinophagaceae bacterium]